jgi:general secretion pathway protein A
VAYTTLIQTWGEKYRDQANPCLQATALDLQCWTSRGGLDDLRQLNIPAVLHMLDNQGQKFYATLIKLEGKSATFAFGNITREVGLDALALQWSGDYTLLLHLPPEVKTTFRTGERGPAIEWLGKQLAQVRGKSVSPEPGAMFDDKLELQVKHFQLAQGLTPDGEVGPKTLARLSAAGDQSAPRLSRGQERK